jgi:quercetin dioxygenase-like cupin family protein
VAEQILAVKDQLRAAGKHCGVMAKSDADLAERQGQGFQVLGLGSDCSLLLRSLHATLASIGRDRKLNPQLEPRDEASRAAPLGRPPESFRPDRPEVMTDRGKGTKVEIQPGVVFECLVGAPQQAKQLTTGVVQLAANVNLARHTHPCTESITLLRGSAVVEVEGRRYRLAQLDNVVVPRGLAHAVENLSPEQPAEFHIAFPTDAPTREFVKPCKSAEEMPDDSRGPGLPGMERVNRIRWAERFEGGLGVTFIDFFNEDLMPGIEMSGGYGLFLPGGRLPAHIHDFDESICIVEGTAGCVVEGRRYKMTGFATALQPRGRVHYFTNETDQPMAMIWVYAGPKAERLVVNEQNATAAGNPWQ